MSRTPRVLVISSCSDTKTQPSGVVWTLTRHLKKEILAAARQLSDLEREWIAELESLGLDLQQFGLDPHQLVQDPHLLAPYLPHPKEQLTELERRIGVARDRLADLRGALGQHMLLEEDFAEPGRLAEREQQLAAYFAAAADMYAGDHHLELMKGIRLLRKTFGEEAIDLKIISAGYGLIDEQTLIVPYDVTFAGLDGATIDGRAAAKGIHRAVEEAVGRYDLVICLLGQEYLRSIRLPVQYDPRKTQFVFMVSSSAMEFLDYDQHYGLVPVGSQEVQDFGAAAVSLKGKVFHLFAQAVCEQGWHLMERVRQFPCEFLPLLKPYRKSGKIVRAEVQPTLFDEEPQAAPPTVNTHFRMSYFMPENEDRVDARFDPWTLVSEARTTGTTHLTDQYAHEILGTAPWDGILISLHGISRWTKQRQEDMFRMGVREYLRYPKEQGLVLGDCGAFTFDEKGEPPFSNQQILEQYRALGIDMGVSLDYVIFPELWEIDPAEAERRFVCNLESAREFWDTWQEMRRATDWEFIPIGVAQGGTPERLAEAVERLQEIGYSYIAVGGLAKSMGTPVTERCLKAIAPKVLPNTQIHLFGFGKLDQASSYRQLGITAFDSTSPLRQAFTRSLYWDPDQPDRAWSAIRVPFPGGRKARSMAEGEGQRDIGVLKTLEAAVLDALRRYDESGTKGDYEAARQALLTYDLSLKPWPYNPHMRAALETLRERPWKRCGCEICRQWGIAVAVLRSNNHNRRRGFHNTFVFYQQKVKSVGPGLDYEQFRQLVSAQQAAK